MTIIVIIVANRERHGDAFGPIPMFVVPSPPILAAFLDFVPIPIRPHSDHPYPHTIPDCLHSHPRPHLQLLY